MAVTTYGSTAASSRIAIGTGGRGGGASWQANMEGAYGSTLISNYAMVKQRHMYQYGTTNEQLAQILADCRKKPGSGTKTQGSAKPKTKKK